MREGGRHGSGCRCPGASASPRRRRLSLCTSQDQMKTRCQRSPPTKRRRSQNALAPSRASCEAWSNASFVQVARPRPSVEASSASLFDAPLASSAQENAQIDLDSVGKNLLNPLHEQITAATNPALGDGGSWRACPAAHPQSDRSPPNPKAIARHPSPKRSLQLATRPMEGASALRWLGEKSCTRIACTDDLSGGPQRWPSAVALSSGPQQRPSRGAGAPASCALRMTCAIGSLERAPPSSSFGAHPGSLPSLTTTRG